MKGRPKPVRLPKTKRDGFPRSSAYLDYDDVKKYVSQGFRPYYRIMQRQGYWLVDDMTQEDDLKPEPSERGSVLVQSLPLWVDVLIKSDLFFRALYSWDDFWDTITEGQNALGDPTSLSEDQWREWLREGIPQLHGGYVAGDGRSIFLRRAEDIGSRIERSVALYDHAYRVMDWLGFIESTMPMWWLFAFMGGKLHRIKVWLPWFKPHIAYWLSEALRACESTVIERAKERESTQPNAISRLSLPPDYDVGDMGRGGKYPQFDPRLLFPKHRRYLESPSTYEPDPFTREKLEAIQDYWQGLDASVRVKGLDAEERAEGVRQGIQEVLTHPMYGLIQAAKFRMSEERRRRSSNIDNLVNECSMGKRPVEDLLEWALTSKPDLVAELAQQGGSTGKAAGHRRKQVGDRLYRQVDAWFRRRNSRMPRPSSDWRDKILK